MLRIEVRDCGNQLWCWVIKAGNNGTLLVSSFYSRKSSVMRAVDSFIRTTGMIDVDRATRKNGVTVIRLFRGDHFDLDK